MPWSSKPSSLSSSPTPRGGWSLPGCQVMLQCTEHQSCRVSTSEQQEGWTLELSGFLVATGLHPPFAQEPRSPPPFRPELAKVESCGWASGADPMHSQEKTFIRPWQSCTGLSKKLLMSRVWDEAQVRTAVPLGSVTMFGHCTEAGRRGMQASKG